MVVPSQWLLVRTCKSYRQRQLDSFGIPHYSPSPASQVLLDQVLGNVIRDFLTSRTLGRHGLVVDSTKAKRFQEFTELQKSRFPHVGTDRDHVHVSMMFPHHHGLLGVDEAHSLVGRVSASMQWDQTTSAFEYVDSASDARVSQESSGSR